MRTIKPSGTLLFTFNVKHLFDSNEIPVLRCNVTSKSTKQKCCFNNNADLYSCTVVMHNESTQPHYMKDGA